MGAKNPASEVSERPAAAFAPALTPHGRLHLAALEDAPALPEDVSGRLREAFDRGAGHGLLLLGAGEVETTLPRRGRPPRLPHGVALDGEPLREDEVARLLATTDGLALVRGQWVEVDPDRLRRTLDKAGGR